MGDNLFHVVEGAQAIIAMGGVFKQVQVYSREGLLYVATSGGYIRVNSDGSTSKPKMHCQFLDLTDTKIGALGRTSLGHLAFGDAATIKNGVKLDLAPSRITIEDKTK